MSIESMVNEFQCPGCVAGSNTKCGSFKQENDKCASHVVGTSILGGDHIAIGLPNGFNKTARAYDNLTGKITSGNKINVSFYTKDDHEKAIEWWNKFNIPVWAMEENGHLFVKIFQPRINFYAVQVIEGGNLSMITERGFNPLNPSEFMDEITALA